MDKADVSIFKQGLWLILSVAIAFMIWALLAALIQNRYFPSPQDVFQVWLDITLTGELPYHVGITLMRVIGSFTLAMLIGTTIGIIMGRIGLLDKLFDGWLILFLNLPALVTIILCYIWFGLNELAAILAVTINKIPNVAVTLREGTRALNKEIDEMAQVYRFSRYQSFRHVILPQLNPYIAAAARSGLALVWKIVLVVELLGRSDGVGFQLHLLFQLFDVTSILAYALSFILVVQAIELHILQPWQSRADRWRA